MTAFLSFGKPWSYRFKGKFENRIRSAIQKEKKEHDLFMTLKKTIQHFLFYKVDFRV